MASDELNPEQLSALLSGSLPEIRGYRVLRRIGRGGMSYVYLCVQESLDRLVAIKIIQPEALVDEVSKQRFESEARTIAKLEHPSIVSIHEVGRTPQGLLYYVMPYLPKGHLGQHDFTQDEQRIADVMRILLSALEYLHERGIVHRDVKADNVLFDSSDRPMLTDFGIALSKVDSARITTAGLALGSGGYMAPEQARGEAVDGRADLYSVGVLAFELLTGRLPFLGNDALSQALMHASDPIPKLPPELKHWQHFIDRAMAKAPAKRFQTTQEMLRSLNQACSREQHTSRQTRALVAMDFRPNRKRQLTLALAATLVIGLVTAIVWKLWPLPPGATQPVAAGTVVAKPVVPAEPAPPVAAEPEPATEPVATTDTDADVDETAVASADTPAAAGAFAKVKARLTVTPLTYDPTVPGARQLTAARRQLALKRVSAPAGDNAIESLAAARKLVPEDPGLAPLSEQVITAMAKALADAVAAKSDDDARSIFQRSEKFAIDAGRIEAPAWKALVASLPAALMARLEKDADSFDGTAMAATKALAGALKVPQSALEPAWSRAGALPRSGQVLSGGGPVAVMVGVVGGTPIALTREEVSFADYAQFVAGSGRATASCRNRQAAIGIKKRSWEDPGFPQNASHPVVCVSHGDALAYAAWLSQRTGHRYRLPSRAEWQLIASYRGNADACRNGHIDCSNDGTAPVRQGPASPLGLFGAQGNVREWLNDCDGACKRRLVAGLGWRDGPRNADPGRTSGFDADTGFDDVGIRLVRVVGK